MEGASSDARQSVGEALAFARGRLGPASEKALLKPENQALVLHRLRGGADPENAALGVLHACAARERGVADEFLAYFLADLRRIGGSVLTAPLRRFLESGDLVQSVLGDLWPELARVQFRTRKEFLAYLGNRLRWKAADRSRGLVSSRRREDLRASGDPELMALAAHGPSPASVAGALDERERLGAVLARLGERDRRILALHLQGASVGDLARELSLSEEAARKALQRAILRARKMLA